MSEDVIFTQKSGTDPSGFLVGNNNLTDVASVPLSRNHLGLGTAATHAATDFDLAGVTGLVKLASGTISSPVSAIDFTLPGGYLSFMISFEAVCFNTADGLNAAFSYDAGSTFLNDPVNADTYFSIWDGNQANGVNFASDVPLDGAFAFSLLYLSDGSNAAPQFVSSTVWVFPGSSAVPSYIRFHTVDYDINTVGCEVISGFSLPNTGATVPPPAPSRANFIRFMAAGSGNASSPDHTITNGSYVLWGVSP